MSAAPGVSNVTSMVLTPPSQSASAVRRSFSGAMPRTMAVMRASRSVFTISVLIVSPFPFFCVYRSFRRHAAFVRLYSSRLSDSLQAVAISRALAPGSSSTSPTPVTAQIISASSSTHQ